MYLNVPQPPRWMLWLGLGLLLGLAPALVYLDWIAYFERFPNVPWWTFFFKG